MSSQSTRNQHSGAETPTKPPQCRRYDSYCHLPPTMVRSTFMLINCDGSVLKGSWSSTTKSATLPGFNEPLISSSNEAYAPFRVPQRMASPNLIRWFAPQTFPLGSVRVICDCSHIIGSEGLAV